jgi:hypothetical protein
MSNDHSRNIANLRADLTRSEAISAQTSATGKFIGYGEPEETRQFVYQPGRTSPIIQREMQTPALYAANLSSIFEGFSEEDKALLAIDMFRVGVYDDITDMFDENNNIDKNFFTRAVGYAVDLAADQAEFALGTEFLDVLLRNGDRSPEELNQLLQQEKQKAQSRTGSVVNYIDPFALADAAKKATASVTGRMATPAEQQAFVKMVHGLQASGVSSISVPARAEAFAREVAPNEAAAMDYANAAGALMQVLGIGG